MSTTLESTIFEALKSLVANRVYPDLAPENTARPYITYHQVGGAAVNFIDSAVPSSRRGRFQVNVWGDTRAQVAAMTIATENALRTAVALQTKVEDGPAGFYDPDTKLRGSMQDFSFIF